MMSERSHRHNPAGSLSFSADTRENVPNRGKQTAAPLSLKRGTGREAELVHRKAHSARRFPLKDIACVLLAQTKDAKDCVCHRVSNSEDADPYTILNALLAMIERKLYSYQNARFKQNSQ